MPTNYARWSVFVATTTMTIWAVATFWGLIASDGQTPVLEIISAILFGVLFLQIAFSFSIATVGAICRMRNRHAFNVELSTSPSADAVDDADGGKRRSAILMPIYNEDPVQVLAGVNAMTFSVHSTGRQDQFDLFILSDTTRPEIQKREADLWRRSADEIKERFPDSQFNLYYRHREKNIGRKAGNIAQFCENWGDQYEAMVILDADSLVEGQTIIQLHDRMLDDPKIGILQVIPVPIGRSSLFARIQQFSADVYGPVYVEGFNAWCGDEGNYFGHNAILRIAAFKRHCALPVLKGKAPLGGEILSHDFVEAALMLRAGYKVKIATDLEGSFEECPTTVSDFAKRDQRWCQGNLQHSKLVTSAGLRGRSRLHLLNGILAYCSAPLLILFLGLTTFSMIAGAETSVDSTLLEQSTHLANSASSANGETGFVDAAFTNQKNALTLFIVSMTLLLLPKFFGAMTTALSATTKKSKMSMLHRLALVPSVCAEVLFSICLAPVMAVLHSRFVLSVLRGKTIQWTAQQRDDTGVSWKEATRDYWPMTLLGCAVVAALFWMSPVILIWFSPFLIGLVFAIPLVVLLGSQSAGKITRRIGLLTTSAERDPPAIEVARDRWLNRLIRDGGR